MHGVSDHARAEELLR